MHLVSIICLLEEDNNSQLNTIKSIINNSFLDWELLLFTFNENSFIANNELQVLLKHENIHLHYISRNNKAVLYNSTISFAKGKYIKFITGDSVLYKYGLSQMVEEMESNPNADFGLSCISLNIHFPLPKVLSPLEAYQMNYTKYPIFRRSLNDSIIKRTVFENGLNFDTESELFITDFFYRLSHQHNLLIMPFGRVWNGIAVQEYLNSLKSSGIALIKYINQQKHYLTHPDCPWLIDKGEFIKKFNKKLIKECIKPILK